MHFRILTIAHIPGFLGPGLARGFLLPYRIPSLQVLLARHAILVFPVLERHGRPSFAPGAYHLLLILQNAYGRPRPSIGRRPAGIPPGEPTAYDTIHGHRREIYLIPFNWLPR